LNAARRDLGLAELRTVPDLFGRVDRVLVLTEKAFDFIPTSRAANVIHVGPVLDEPDDSEPWSSPWDAGDPRPLVLVTTSSYFQDPHTMLDTACAAVRKIGARAVVTTGAVDPAGLPRDESIFAARSLPHDQLMRQADAVISHCGLGTVHRALTFGVPLLCQPIGRDQPDVAARVVAAGAGLRQSPKAPPARVARGLNRLLTDRTYREHASDVGARLRRAADRQAYLAELESAAEAQKSSPVHEVAQRND